jgi:aryl-alcohol dehydrogenase-like predicted oxidoreductase
MKKIIYGMARFCNEGYGYGSKLNLKLDKKKFIGFVSKKIKIVEFSTSYKNSLNYLLYKNSFKKFHFKIDGIRMQNNNVEKYIYENISNVLKKLHIKYIDVLYLHQDDMEIISSKKIQNILTQILKSNLVKNIGVSLYNEAEIKYALKNDIYSYLQIPINITNTYYYLKYLEQFKKKRIVARSIYLQGTLLNNYNQFKFKKELDEYLCLIKDLSNKNNIKFYDLITLFVFNLNLINYYLFGSINKENTSSFLNINNKKINQSLMNELLEISSVKRSWNNPRNW